MGESSRNYQNGKIYCITNWVDDDIYVGSTCQPLSKRLAFHKSHINSQKHKDGALPMKMKEIGRENFYIELLERVECNSQEELRKEEGKWIREMGTLNKNIAGRTAKEYNAQYYLDNKTKCNAQSKKWQTENNERETKRLAEHYENNKEQINLIRSAKNNCECGGKYTTGHKSHHFKSKKHQAFIERQKNII